MPRTLVVLPTSSYRTADFVRAATRLGVDLTVASEEDPPLDLGDNFVRIDCGDPEGSAAAIADAADKIPIDAVIAADDAGVIIAALAAEKLGLPGNPPEAAAATRDKSAMRRLLAAAEVPQPAFVEAGDDPDAVAGLGFPVVLKPRTGTASRGVLRVDQPEDLPGAIGRVGSIARALGEAGPLLAEAYVPGVELAVEGLVVNGVPTVLALFDKPDTSPGPTFPETLFVTPSTQPAHVQAEITRVVEAAVSALGLQNGPIHAEVRLDAAGRVHLLEMAARSIGGLCGRSLRFGLTNSGLEEQILAASLGRQTMAPQPRPAGVYMLPTEREGTLTSVAGVAEVEAMAGITEVDITVPVGTEVRPLPEGDRYLGFIFGVGPTPGAVADLLRTAAARLDIRITP